MPRYNNSKARQALNNYKRAVDKLNQGIRNYNREVDRVNAANRRAIDNYNRGIREHNARVRANRQRLNNEIARLNSHPPRVVYTVTYRTSAQTLVQSFRHVETSYNQGTWTGGDELFDMAEGETANSVALLNALENRSEAAGDGINELQQTSITTELDEISSDLSSRWDGALYSLSPRNPDAARHFCTSAREILVKILDLRAPDNVVRAAMPNIQLTPNNQVPRREKIRYCLVESGRHDAQLATFVDDDINNVMDLFGAFNPATHGEAGKYSLAQLSAIKTRVEGAIKFLHRIIVG